MPESADSFDVITMGRIGIDLYPLQTGVPLARVETFGKFLGGSAANVAVAAARLGNASAVITRTGDDPFGTFLHEALKEFGVDDRFVTPVATCPTPVTFCEIFPPDDFPLYFYRRPKAPDLEIHTDELDFFAIRAARVFWITGTGLSEEPSRSATLAALKARDRSGITVFDLDWRPALWNDAAWADPEAARPYYAEALRHATVAVGNLDECEIATGVREPRACAEALLEGGGGAGRRQTGTQGCPRGPSRRHGRRGTARAGGGRQRPRRGRRVRRRPLPWAAARLGAGAHHAVRQRRGRDRRVPAGLLVGDADGRGSGGTGGGRVTVRCRVRVRWGLVAQSPAPLKSRGCAPCFSPLGARGTARATTTHPHPPHPPHHPIPDAPTGVEGAAPLERSPA